jgi:hypothetical protein
MTTVLIVFFSIVSIALIITFATLPWWLARSLHGHRIWRLRDNFVGDILSERLPEDHPAVRQLLRRFEFVLKPRAHPRRITMINLVVMLAVRRTVSPATREYVDKCVEDCSLDGLEPVERDRLVGYRDRLNVLLAGSTLTGSWLGIAVVFVFLVPAFVQYRRQQRRQEDAGIEGLVYSAGLATDMAVERTPRLVGSSNDLYRPHPGNRWKPRVVV